MDQTSVPIIGLASSEKLRLIKRILTVNNDALKTENDEDDLKGEIPEFVKNYKDCFGELVTLEEEHHIIVDKSVVPVVNAARQVPISMQNKVKDELHRLVNLGVIEEVNEPTDWVNSMVVVEKPNGKLRVCIDPQHLNKAEGITSNCQLLKNCLLRCLEPIISRNLMQVMAIGQLSWTLNHQSYSHSQPHTADISF